MAKGANRTQYEQEIEIKDIESLLLSLELRRESVLKAERAEIRRRAENRIEQCLIEGLFRESWSQLNMGQQAKAMTLLNEYLDSLITVCLSTHVVFKNRNQDKQSATREELLKARLIDLISSMETGLNFKSKDFDIEDTLSNLIKSTEPERYLRNALVQKSYGIKAINNFVKKNKDLYSEFNFKNSGHLKNFDELFTKIENDYYEKNKKNKSSNKNSRSESALKRDVREWSNFVISTYPKTEKTIHKINEKPTYVRVVENLLQNQELDKFTLFQAKQSNSRPDLLLRNKIEIDFRINSREGLKAIIKFPPNLTDKKARFVAKFYEELTSNPIVNEIKVGMQTGQVEPVIASISGMHTPDAVEAFAAFVIRIASKFE